MSLSNDNDTNVNLNPEMSNTENTAYENTEKQKTFTQEELNRAISVRLSQQKEKHEKVLSEKLSEAEKLAKMNAEQKADYEKQQFEKKMAEREASIARRELLAEAKEQLSRRELPAELIDCLDLSSAENCKRSLAAVENAFSSSVEKKINGKLRLSPPGKSCGAYSKDPFMTGIGL